MKKLLLILVFLAASVAASAEQKVIVLVAGDGKPDISEVTALLARGWKITLVSCAGAGTDSIFNRQFSYVFVLEK